MKTKYEWAPTSESRIKLCGERVQAEVWRPVQAHGLKLADGAECAVFQVRSETAGFRPGDWYRKTVALGKGSTRYFYEGTLEEAIQASERWITRKIAEWRRSGDLPPVRYAVATVRQEYLATVGDYLPSNYRVAKSKTSEVNGDYVFCLIEGVDDHGWTLDGYVIPRLASGIIPAVEITAAQRHDYGW